MASLCVGDFLMNETEFESTPCNITPVNLTRNGSGFYQPETVQEVLLRVLGPRRSPFFLPVTVTYLFIFITGVVGNLLTCTVIVKHREMHTPSNLYLFSLAISDLLVLVFGMPLEIYDLWQNYPFPFSECICYFKILLFETVCFASVLNVTVLSVERYLAVMHPLMTRYAITNQHAQRVITGVWAVSLLCAIPNTSLHGVYYLYLPERVLESATCSLIKPRWIYNLVIQITTVLFYFIPMTVISVLYVVIGLRLGKEQRQQECRLVKTLCSETSWKFHMQTGRRRKVTKKLSVVVLVFAICWAPFHIDRLLWSFITQWTDYMHDVFEYVHILSGVLFYLSSAVNPLIYNLLSTHFRECFRELVCRHFKSHPHRHSLAKPCTTSQGSVTLMPSAPSHQGRSHPSYTSNSGWDGKDETVFI